MNTLLNFTIPSWLELDELQILSVQQQNSNEAVVIVGENLDDSKLCRPTIRLYLAKRLDQSFECVKELDAFLFNSKEQAIEFSEKIPTLSALDLVVQRNKYYR
jgi:hypothetical protein